MPLPPDVLYGPIKAPAPSLALQPPAKNPPIPCLPSSGTAISLSRASGHPAEPLAFLSRARQAPSEARLSPRNARPRQKLACLRGTPGPGRSPSVSWERQAPAEARPSPGNARPRQRSSTLRGAPGPDKDLPLSGAPQAPAETSLSRACQAPAETSLSRACQAPAETSRPPTGHPPARAGPTAGRLPQRHGYLVTYASTFTAASRRRGPADA
jgi:hypothetical protein